MREFITAQARPAGGQVSDAEFEALQQRVQRLKSQIADVLPGAASLAVNKALTAALAPLRDSNKETTSNASARGGFRLPSSDDAAACRRMFPRNGHLIPQGD